MNQPAEVPELAEETVARDNDMARLTVPSNPSRLASWQPMNATRPLPSRSRAEKQERRLHLALFIKILLKVLKDEGEILLYQQVRMVISMCTRGHKLTAMNATTSNPPLEDIVEAHLRPLVGDSHWRRARHLQRHYLARHWRSRRRFAADSSVSPETATWKVVHV